MQPHPRYQVLEQIAVGDFATVFRGKDLELNRDVAIKQIHPQFLADQRQLERYWQEAQLLASLEHPNIMTIYDIARDRGWLILELMQASLKDRAAGQPMDLNFLRVALVCALQALKFLHSKGIVHGDVKPSNMMLDKRNWVKLGDFGLAQRVVNDQGSLLKGTTKYMAPERVSDQFGPVGPQSDLYSLGFSIYELMCGDAFQTLFPGLGAFGRDQQIAWMMWQAAPDRQLPEIRRVLQGVPDDLIHVIQRLVTKDPRRRYQTADEAIRDLKSGLGYGPSQAEQEQQAAEAAAKEVARRKNRRVMLAITACASLVLCVGMLFIPAPSGPRAHVKATQSIHGIIRNKFPDQRKVFLDTKDSITFNHDDLVWLNGEQSKFEDILEGDQLVVTVHREPNGKVTQEIRAYRPEQTAGTLKSKDLPERTIVVSNGLEGPSARDIAILVPDTLSIEFNGQAGIEGRPATLADLEPGDHVVVEHKPRDKGREATSLSVTRVVSVEGAFVLGVDAKRKTLTVALGASRGAPQATWPLAADCDVTINRKKFLTGRPIVVDDLRPGDEVSLRHDTQIVSIAAERVVTRQGVLREIPADGRSLIVQLNGEDQPKTFLLDAETTILRLKPEPPSNPQSGSDAAAKDRFDPEKVSVADLQIGDAVDIRFDNADAAHPVALDVEATRPIDHTRWAILVAEQDYRDPRISALTHPRGDVQRLREVLIRRYRLDPNQVVMIVDADRVALEQIITAAVKPIEQNAHLLVYVASHAYRGSDNLVYLAPSDFSLSQRKETGVPLGRFLTVINDCPAADKLLILDTCQAGTGIDIPLESSPEKFVAMVKQSSEEPLLTTTKVIASCQEGQRGLVGPDGHGELADVLREAYTGRADVNGDHLVTAEELFEFVKNEMRTASEGRQTPVFIPPQQIVLPRLSAEAKQAIGQLAAAVLEDKIDAKKLKDLYESAVKAAPKQPEPRTLHGLALLKDKQFPESAAELLAVLQQFPDERVPIEGVVWSFFQRRMYSQGINGLVMLVGKMPKDKSGTLIVDPRTDAILEWAGRLREFAGDASGGQRPAVTTLEKLDQSVALSGDAAQASYRRGQQHVRDVNAAFDKRYDQAADEAEKLKVNLERRRIVQYVAFPFEATVQRVLDGMRK